MNENSNYIAALHPILANRWSPRSFKDTEIEPRKLIRLFEAARWAPSCANAQPWRFIIGKKGQPGHDKLVDCLTGNNPTWAKNAPLLILSTASTAFQKDNKPNRHAYHDTGIALASLIFQAGSMGLHAHPMAGFVEKKARSAFSIPEDQAVICVTAVGYLDTPDKLPDDLAKTETDVRRRKPLTQIVCENDWDIPAQF